MILHTEPQGSAEWKAARCGLATASRFADILATIKSGEAASRRNYRAQVVVERLTGKPLASFETASMRQGTEREPLARQAYEVATGNVVREVGFIQHGEVLCGASLDGLVDPKGGIECKCPEIQTHLEYLRLKAEPSAYTSQIQGCMWIAELDWIDFVSWNPDFPPHLQLIIRRVPRDEKAIASLRFAVGVFMEEVRTEESEIRALPAAA